MKNEFIRRMAQVWVMGLLLLAGAVSTAQESTAKAKGPQAVVEKTTEDLMTVVRQNQALLESNPDEYFNKVRAVLEPVVDFGYIAYGVMGPHWKTATEAQRKAFVDTFRDSLIETYAKGMANYADLQIAVLPVEDDISKGKVGVVQEITGPDGTNRVAYTMRRSAKTGEWKLTNMVLDGVNLGKTFRNQFAQAAKQRDGDLTAVIENWSAES